jgi:hypothetical protein
VKDLDASPRYYIEKGEVPTTREAKKDTLCYFSSVPWFCWDILCNVAIKVYYNKIETS